MTAPAGWLARAEPAPPAELRDRLVALLGPAALADGEAAVRGCVDGAERVVAGLLRDGSTDRASALDLLAADALATYAFELAADRPERLGAVAEAAMARFAALGTTLDTALGTAPPGPAAGA